MTEQRSSADIDEATLRVAVAIATRRDAFKLGEKLAQSYLDDARVAIAAMPNVAQAVGMPLEKPDGWIVKNKSGGIELFLDHDRALAAFSAWGSFIGPLYSSPAQPPAAPVETEYRWPGDNKTQSERQRCSAGTAEAAGLIERADKYFGCGSAQHEYPSEILRDMTNYLRRLPTAQPQEAWQPIKSAPKDGTKVLLRDGTDNTIVVGFWSDAHTQDSDERLGEFCWRVCWDHTPWGGYYEPDFWHPIPAYSVTRPEHRAPTPSAPVEPAPSQRRPE